MRHVRSAACALLTPAGVTEERRGANGTAAVLADLITRGAGERDSRQLSAEFDRLGIQSSELAGVNFLSMHASMLAEQVSAALSLYAEILLRPHLDPAQIEPILAGMEQGLRAVEDEPQRRVLIELRRRCYPDPWGRPSEGTLAELEHIGIEEVRELFRKGVRPNGAIFGVAGNVEPERVAEQVEKLFAKWQRIPEPAQVVGAPGPPSDHLLQESAQMHIGLAAPAVPYGHADYFKAWAAASILSGGSSSRLFTELREKRGLCYSVHASLHSLKHDCRLLAYVGTSPPSEAPITKKKLEKQVIKKKGKSAGVSKKRNPAEAIVDRAQLSLDLLIEELRRLPEGLQIDELDRCKARAKSELIMQQESTGSRASTLTRDWYHLNRVQTLPELRSIVDALTIDDVAGYLHQHPFTPSTLLTIGPKPLHIPNGLSGDDLLSK